VLVAGAPDDLWELAASLKLTVVGL
jgi:hypothetical protein